MVKFLNSDLIANLKAKIPLLFDSKVTSTSNSAYTTKYINDRLDGDTVILGNNATVSRGAEVSVGSPSLLRNLSNVKTATLDYDAVNLKQLKDGFVTKEDFDKKVQELIEMIEGGGSLTPTLENLKSELDKGTAPKTFPVGTEIEDTTNGVSDPLIVAHYLDGSNNINYGFAEGVILVRKYLTQFTTKYDSTDKVTYGGSLVDSYLTTDYPDIVNPTLTSLIGVLSLPYQNASGSVLTSYKRWFTPSVTELFGSATNEGAPFELFKQKTGLSSANNDANNGRKWTQRTGGAQYYHTRTRANDYAYYRVDDTGRIWSGGIGAVTWPIMACCFIPA